WASLQRRLAHHRSAGRGAGQRIAKREHPGRRHQRRTRCRGPRSIPVPARPPIAAVLAPNYRAPMATQTVPDLMLGCWRRAWIEFADGRRDDTTVVVWLQTDSL